MKKYLAIIKAAWHGQMVYRINFFMHRVGNLFEISSQVIVWAIIFQDQEMVRGYTFEEMVTYVVLGWLFMFITGNYGLEHRVSDDIRTGRLSNLLVKPMSYLRYISTLSIGRISIALTTAVSMQMMVFILLQNWIIFVFDWEKILLIFAMLFFGYFLRLFLAIAIGFVGFWTTEVNGVFVCASVIIKFLSGAFFPINLLPESLVKLSLSFPFVYTFFAPTQIYLGKMTWQEGVRGLGVEIVWLVILYLIIKFFWRKGLKKYESVGI